MYNISIHILLQKLNSIHDILKNEIVLGALISTYYGPFTPKTNIKKMEIGKKVKI